MPSAGAMHSRTVPMLGVILWSPWQHLVNAYSSAKGLQLIHQKRLKTKHTQPHDGTCVNELCGDQCTETFT